MFKIDFLKKLNDLFDKKEKIQFMLVMISALTMAFFQTAGIASVLPFIKMIMDPDIIQQNFWLNYVFELIGFKTNDSFIIFSGFFVLALLMVGNSIAAFSTWLKIHFVWKKNHTLSAALLEKYMSMPYSYFLNQNTAGLGKNVLSEVHQLTSNFLMPLTKVMTDTVLILTIILLLLYVNIFMTFFAAAVLILFYLGIFFYFSEKLKIAGKKRLAKNMDRFKSANEALGGIKDIKVAGAEKFFLDRFAYSSEIFSSLQSWYQAVGQIPRYVMEIVAFGGIVGLMIFLVYFNKSTQEIIPLVSFFAFAGYRLMPALQEIFNSLTVMKFNKAVLDKIHEEMSEKSTTHDQSVINQDIVPIIFNDEIKLENIYFSYPNSTKTALNNINIKIKKNSFVAIIGSTGSGKTTLIDIILGLFYPERGSLRVDDILVEEKNVKNWQKILGYVPQYIYLSDDTIARNIAFGISDDKIDMDQVERVAKMANLNSFIKNELPEGYRTIIGERGVRLSGGQRQRIGIARALYKNPQVLILDEATSSLDNETEKAVMDAIDNVAKQKTIIVIAHRMTTVKNCDKVYVVDNGKIINVGVYNEIIKEEIDSLEN